MAKPSAVQGLRPETRAQEAARRWIAARAEDVRHHAGRTARALEEEPVHDLRVALRRLRAACALFGKQRLREIGAKLKRTQDAAGAVREVHVLRAVATAGTKGKGPARSLDAAWHTELTRRQDEAGQTLLVELARLNSRTLPALLLALEEQVLRGRLDGHRLRARFAGLLDHAIERLQEARGLNARPAHRLRVSLKRLRDSAELLAPARPEELRAFSALLAPLQERLGALHDLDELLAQAEPRPAQRVVQETQARREILVARLRNRLGGLATALDKARRANEQR